MCGITGYVQRRGPAPPESLLDRMNESLVHRGPDDGGAYRWSAGAAGPHVGLAMRRLAIIDLQTGHQPLANEDGSVWIVFNGEIYNHEALRRDLAARGHHFRTRSDTEAIVHAYEEYGTACVSRFRGMFAFAIWDERRQELFLARDPVGIKPLYWTQTAQRLLFASEAKALFRDPDVPRAVNREVLPEYLTCLSVRAPRTLFAGIRQLPPGHWLRWRDGQIETREYWAGPEALLTGEEGPVVTAAQVWEVLRESVDAHRISDVPLGAFLSGGIDSTVVVAALAELEQRPRTFSIGFRGAGLYDELKHARTVAAQVGTEHEEFVVDPDSVALLPEIVRHLDEPLGDPSVIPNYLLAQLARRYVTVALAGTGGDELFGGYRRYLGDRFVRRWRWLPRTIRRSLLLPLLRCFPSSDDTRLGEAVRLAEKFFTSFDLDPERRYLAWNAGFDATARQRVLPDGGDPFASYLALFERVRHRPFPDQAMYVDLRTYLPGDPLLLTDRMTMAHGLEARVPFLDLPVMEFAARVPLIQKLRGNVTKAILRDVLRDRFPPSIWERPKRGFGTPIDLWLQRELAGLVKRLLSPAVVRERGYFDPDGVAWLVDRQARGRGRFSQEVWTLLVFEIWHRIFIDRDYGSRAGLTFADLDLPASDGKRRSFPAPRKSLRATVAPADSTPRRIACLRRGGLGDTLSTLPALRALRQAFPEARLCLLTDRIGAGLLWESEDGALVDEIVSLDCLYSGRHAAILTQRFWHELRAYVRWARRFRPDLFVCMDHLFEWGESLRPALMALLSGARRRVGRASGRTGWFLTERVPDSRWLERSPHQRNLDLAAYLGARIDGLGPYLAPRAPANEWAAAERRRRGWGGRPIVTMHALGTRESRHWPACRFIELAHSLRARHGLVTAFIGAPAEAEALVALTQSLPDAGVIAPPSLEEAAAWLRESTLVVGNDSGIVHMAVAVGTPVVAIFGPGEHQLWGYFDQPGYELVRLELPCWPCYRPHCGPEPCLARLEVAPVLAACERLLHQPAAGRSAQPLPIVGTREA